MSGESDKIKGYVCSAKGSDLEPFEYEAGPLAPAEVELRVTHNGLCHTDIHMRDNDWGCTTYPLVAGHEVVGVVEALGEQVKGLQKGDRVAVAWIRDSCRSCDPCIRGEENICTKGYIGLILGGNKGGFQERMRVPADFAHKIPDGLASEDVAPLMCAGLTVFLPLRDYITRPGMRVGIIGIGGLGHLGLQFANKMGAHTVAFSTTPAKEEEARGFGAHEFIVFNPEGNNALTPEQKVDLLINTAPVAPKDGKYHDQMGMLRADGGLVLVGIPPACDATVNVIDLVFGGKKLIGSIVGGRLATRQMLDFCVTHQIKPKIQVMPLSEVNEAMKIVLANQARYRIVLTTE